MRDINLNMIVTRKDSMNISASFRNIDEFTALGIDSIRQYLIKIICKRGTHLELDLSGIKFINSDGFDTLNLVYRLGKKYGSTLTLIGVETEVLEMINLMKKYYVFHIPQVESA